MAFNVYHNPKSVTIGATPITGVSSITAGQTFSEIHAAADDDTHESVARHTTARTRGAIALVDPTQAEAAAGLTGSLSFVWTDVKGGSDKTVTIANCSLGDWEAQVGRDAASAATVSFIAESAPQIA